jgi:hypothetical protein
MTESESNSAGRTTDKPIYITQDSAWQNAACPICGKATIGHAWLYGQPSPAPGTVDGRRTRGEVFQHADCGDCRVMVSLRRRE